VKTIQYKGRKGKETHHVYSVEEADELGVPYLPDWRDFERAGQWILTDDQNVVEVLATGKMRTGTPWLRTATGSFLHSSGTILDTKPRDSRYTFNGLKVANQPFRITERQRQWIMLFARGLDPVKSYLRIFRGSSHEHAERRVFDLLKRPEVKAIVRKEVENTCRTLGIDEEFVLSKMKNWVDNDDMSDNVRFKCLNTLAEIIEVTPEKKNGEPIGGFIGFGSVVEDVESGKQLGGNPSQVAEGQRALPQVDTLEEDFMEDE
jgi:hypothetical protein